MRILVLAILALMAGSSCYSLPRPYTVTFEDIPAGQDVGYYYTNPQYLLGMVPGWQVVGSAASGWGTPHSGTHAVIWDGNPQFGTAFGFGSDGVLEYTVRSVGAYFSTEPGVVLQMCGYSLRGAVFTANIGTADGTWSDHYVEINSASGDIAYVHIRGVSSSDARYHFAMDDLSVVTIPEPSSLLALLAGLGGFGVMLKRRR